jgi:PAS domain S-box-containing protein
MLQNQPYRTKWSSSMIENCEFYEDLLDQLGDGICYLDKSLKIQYCNREVENLTGIQKSEMIGQQFWARDAVRPGDTGITSKHTVLKEVTRGQEMVIDENLTMDNGKTRPVQIKMIPFKNPTGEVVGAIEVIRDNSEIREFELKVEELENWHIMIR